MAMPTTHLFRTGGPQHGTCAVADGDLIDPLVERLVSLPLLPQARSRQRAGVLPRQRTLHLQRGGNGQAHENLF